MCESLPTWIIAIATVAYAAITVFMLIDSKKQIEALKDQTRSNNGIQLYSYRRQVLDQYNLKNYDAIAQDITVLFGIDYYSRMSELCHEENRIAEILDDKRKMTAMQKIEVEHRKLYTDMVDYVTESIINKR